MCRISSILSALIMMLTLAGCADLARSGEPAAPAVDAQPAQHVMKRFMQVCMDTQGKPDRVRAIAERIGARPLQPQTAKVFLNEIEGSAWAEQNALGSYVFASRNDGVCSVFVRQVDVDSLEKAFTLWLPNNQSGFTAKEAHSAPSGQGFKTVAYDIFRHGEPIAVWVLSTSRQDNVNFQGVVSLRGN